MIIINVLFISFISYLLLFVGYVLSDGFSEIIYRFFKLDTLYYLLPVGNELILSLCLFLFCLGFGIYYKLFKKFSPRWRVYSANKIIKNIRKGIQKGDYSKNQSLYYLKKIDPFIFEEILLSLFYERGFKIKRNKKYTGDGGSDGLIWIAGKKTHIQAKRYKSYISKTHMEEFAELIDKDKTLGIFIHTGKTGKKTQEVADLNSIFLISGAELVQFLLGEDIFVFNKLYTVRRKIKNK